jgi:hypothetical protein
MRGSIPGFPRNMALSEGRERGREHRPHTYEMRSGERAVSSVPLSSLRNGERLGGDGLHAMERLDWSI